MSFIYNMADTWNAVGTTFNAILMNVSNGAGGSAVGAAASRVLNLQNNSSSIFSVDIAGKVYILGDQYITSSNDGGNRIYMFDTGDGRFKIYTNGAERINIGYSTGDTTFLGGGTPILPGFTIASLPGNTAGRFAYITNSTATMVTGLGLAPVAGGTNVVPVFNDGTGWKII